MKTPRALSHENLRDSIRPVANDPGLPSRGYSRTTSFSDSGPRPGAVISCVERPPLPSGEPVVNALTVDVEDYFHVSAFDPYVLRSHWDRLESRVEKNVYRLLEVFAEQCVRGTFFFLGCVAEQFPELVEAVYREGHEVASHGWSHRRVTSLSVGEFRREVRESKALLEELCGDRVFGYRAPSFSITSDVDWAFEVLVEEGYSYDSSVRELLTDSPCFPQFPSRLSTASGEIDEFPLPTLRVLGRRVPFTGGNYLRQFPKWVNRRGLHHVNHSSGQPAMLYIHPWEIDPDQPRVDVSWITALRHYRNLSNTEQRLQELLTEYDFDSMYRVLHRSCES